MKNVMKIMLVALTAISFSVANAGELSVTGSAKASYVITSSDGNAGKVELGKGLGVANEFTLSASGELDNGMSWNYAQDIDNGTVQDDGKIGPLQHDVQSLFAISSFVALSRIAVLIFSPALIIFVIQFIKFFSLIS